MHDPPLLQAKAQTGKAKITVSVPCEASSCRPFDKTSTYDAPNSAPILR
jgi:hypothetical protein